LEKVFTLKYRDIIKNWAIILLLIGLVFIISCHEPTSPPEEISDVLPAIDVPWTAQQSVVCFGTSLTYGFIWEEPIVVPGEKKLHQHPITPLLDNSSQSNSSYPTYAYPALLGASLKIKVYNQGNVGATTQRALDIVRDSIFNKNPALVLLEFGANDLLRGIKDSLVEIRLGNLIDTLYSFGSKVVLISFLNQGIIESIPTDHFLASKKSDGTKFLSMLQRVATNHSLLLVENAMSGIYWNDTMMSDEFHPNENGYKKMQENISRTLLKTFQKNGMLK
jgi:lysophospholipase L1-like esterase